MVTIVREYGAAVIGLTMDEEGIPDGPEVRLSIAGKIPEGLTKPAFPLRI
jgi:5-methyltetrahydrofolate--homocysteine methyltransferase